MNMNLLELLKQRGKTLVLQGPQGCGKGLLAKQLAGDPYSEADIHDILGERSQFQHWLKDQVKTVIVEGVPICKDIDKIKSLITCGRMVREQEGRASETVNTPQFIFCTSNPEPLDFGLNDRRFYVIKMTTVL